MIRLLALKVSTYIWESPQARKLDGILSNNGIRLLDFPWGNCELLENDSNHFTRQGLIQFCENLGSVLHKEKVKRVWIVSDSTIDFWNWDRHGKYTGNASRMLNASLMRWHIEHVALSAWCGSGFEALKKDKKDLGSLLRNTLKDEKFTTAPPDSILIIGGWNDLASENAFITTDRSMNNTIRSFVTLCHQANRV